MYEQLKEELCIKKVKNEIRHFQKLVPELKKVKRVSKSTYKKKRSYKVQYLYQPEFLNRIIPVAIKTNMVTSWIRKLSGINVVFKQLLL